MLYVNVVFRFSKINSDVSENFDHPEYLSMSMWYFASVKSTVMYQKTSTLKYVNVVFCFSKINGDVSENFDLPECLRKGTFHLLYC